jgi:methylated-DNA-protein-cysteine methyltransferase related protein
MNKYEAIYELVRLVPKGEVASYGMIASLLTGVTPRMVGFAMAGVKPGGDIPWQRIINSSGGISPRPGAERQYSVLISEGITFSKAGKVSWKDVRWNGPDDAWLEKRGIEFHDFLSIQFGWP